jgi:pilus assembly protein Flp/PilA
MKHLVKSFIRNESGATAIEYALIVALVGVGIVSAFGSFGTKLKTGLEKTLDYASNKAPAS